MTTPIFPLKPSQIQVPSPQTPSKFHKVLINNISNAKYRIKLASLYVGSGVSAQELNLLSALNSARSSNIDVKILMDYKRGLRPIHSSSNNSAKSVKHCYLYHHNPNSYITKPPFNEVTGVFHMKIYIIDDTLILSGANLSDEYFTSRFDRFIVIQSESHSHDNNNNDNNNIVEFYSSLVDILCEGSHEYFDSMIREPKICNEELYRRLCVLFERYQNIMNNNSNGGDGIVYAIPTISIPSLYQSPTTVSTFIQNFKSSSFIQLGKFFSHSSKREGEKLNIYLSSAYLNPTASFLSTLTGNFLRTNLLTGNPFTTSHPFSANQNNKTHSPKPLVPLLYGQVVQKLSEWSSIDMFLFEKEGCTYHGKGIWLASKPVSNTENLNHSRKISSNERLLATVIGSSNYNSRSTDLDAESDLLLLFCADNTLTNTKSPDFFKLQQQLKQQWNNYLRYSTKATDYLSQHQGNMRNLARLIFPIVKKFL